MTAWWFACVEEALGASRALNLSCFSARAFVWGDSVVVVVVVLGGEGGGAGEVIVGGV